MLDSLKMIMALRKNCESISVLPARQCSRYASSCPWSPWELLQDLFLPSTGRHAIRWFRWIAYDRRIKGWGHNKSCRRYSYYEISWNLSPASCCLHRARAVAIMLAHMGDLLLNCYLIDYWSWFKNRVPVALLVEHQAVTREVVSSTLAWPTLRVLK